MFNEEIEKSKTNKKFFLAKSDEPGTYSVEDLKAKLIQYFTDKRKVPQAIKFVLMKLCLANQTVTRDMIKKELVSQGYSPDIPKSFAMVSNMSTQMSLEKNAFLRQVISYSYPVNPWEKDNYHINQEHRKMIAEICLTSAST